MNLHEKELLGNLKSYDKVPENLKLEFLRIKRKKSTKWAPACWVDDLGNGLILGVEAPAGYRKGSEAWMLYRISFLC